MTYKSYKSQYKMLRTRKNRRYNETNDEEGDGERKFDIIAQVKSQRFDQIRDKHLLELPANEITLQYVQKNGFDKPILVVEPEGLELRVPPKTFLVRDVRNCVGQHRVIDVMDVKTQKNIEMSMKDWCKYYESKSRDRLLNVISLEFSHTKLDELVESPMIVRLLDWVDLVWPKFLKESQTESTNTIDKMKYPKVQKYCLMSVKGSYTDFHIDFGGTSVWYHILRGRKIFWMVPPTELNLQIFEEWTLSGMQQDVFFGDTVEECFRVELNAGNTFFIPSGWVHAVYTLEDSLVFGGNFLHSFGIENQLKVSKIEDATKVPHKFRYPFYTEILWYVVQHYVYCLTQKDHLHRPPPTVSVSSQSTEAKQPTSDSQKSDKVHAEIEDESTESEQYESDSKKRKSTASSKRKLRGRLSKKSRSPKKATKLAPPTDDESTDIDSSNEDTVKPTKIPPTNTCRMTKNSLLRLQYEVEEQQLASSSKTTSKDGSSTTPKSQKKKSDETSPAVAQPQSSTMNLAEIVLSHESKLNGWSSGAGQSVWSNRSTETKEPKKIHITKYEVNGLKVLVKHLSKLSGTKKNLPTLIRNSRALLDDCRKLITEHENDDPELAITGKPITIELMCPAKKTDMNELIGQFFKPTETASGDDSKSSNTPITSHTSKSNNLIASKTDTISPTSQQRLKSINLDGSQKGDEKKTSSSSSSHESPIDKEHSFRLSSPHKETKCLSPKKLAHSITSLTGSNSSPPPRPKSPPTRPLSNNQYTSKTKNNNNLILPGSFADLIAATSTEKKASDSGSSPASSALFGARESSSAKPASPYPSTSKTKSNNNYTQSGSFADVMGSFYPSPIKNSTREKDKSSSGPSTSNKKPANTNKPTLSASSGTSQIIDTLSPSLAVAGTNVTKEQSLPPKQPNSPEPPKSTIQKRFITPQQFRPINKEKLIYASAPYISPVHASDQVRSSNASYPWQMPNPSYSPSTPRQPIVPTAVSSTTTQIQVPTYSPANSQPSTSLSSHELNSTSQITPGHKPRDHSAQGDTNNNKESTGASHSVLKLASIEQPSNLKSKDPKTISQTSSESGCSNKLKTKILTSDCLEKDRPTPPPTISSKTEDEIQSSVPSKKITKPKCPPKKSKEARQVLEQSNIESEHPVATSVIKMAVLPQMIPPPATVTTQAPTAPTAPKAKAKRVKKQKDSDKSANVSAGQPSNPQGSLIYNTQLRPQQRQVVCGLVAPPASSTSSTKPTSQSYLISRPLIFNTMPAYSTAQFQQMSRVPVPLLTTPMSSHLGLPLQQGTRIVWATQPQRLSGQAAGIQSNLQNPVTSFSPIPTTPLASTTTTAKIVDKFAPSTSQPRTPSAADNAALLSLATTALSTAPMMSSSTLGQLSNRTSAQQAIMVSSASNQQSLFAAGQQLFRPFMQRLPMTRFVTHPGVSGVPRAPQSGQLVFARIPNQSQPRYLITPPGFMQQRFQSPQMNVNQPTPTIAFTTIKPPTSDAGKAMKTKKVKTN